MEQAEQRSEPLPELRADHIPDDVLSEQDAEARVVSPDADSMAALTGEPEDLLAEMDADSRIETAQALTPTDEETLDLTQDEPTGP